MRKTLLLLAFLLLTPMVAAGEESVWTLCTESGDVLTQICYEPAVGDEYVSADNQLYEIIGVDENVAYVRARGSASLPDISWLDADAAQPVSALSSRQIGLYCTHSDESYEPSDGTYSNSDRGTIYLVAQSLASALEERGIQAAVDDALHHPHDAGAYRRSRQTAVRLMKTMPDALLDIHRDGIPDPDSYRTKIGGKSCSKVRILVGRGNQNMEANKALALRIKAVADKVYPGLIKDIYMGKGVYNQDLLPHSILLECGTYTISRELVEASMPMMADVLSRSLYGGVTGSAGTTDVRNAPGSGGITQGEGDLPQGAKGNTGAGSGILWLIGIVVLGAIIFGVAATGSASGAARKAGRHLSEVTGGLIGKKPRDDEKPPQS